MVRTQKRKELLPGTAGRGQKEEEMGFFDKKYCDICGDKIGLLGNKKLEDGNLCKNCAAKLSPFFSERRHSTVEEIREQLAYREDNKAAVKAFHTTRSFGQGKKLLIDEDAKKFMVTSARDLEEANPDVIDFADVTGCDLKIDEDRDEIKKKDAEGKSVSYDPPRYEYSYNFDILIRVNNPYFDEISMRLNNSRVKTGERSATAAAHKPVQNLAQAMLQGAASVLVSGGAGADGAWNAEYLEYKKMGEEIRDVLMQTRQEVRDEIARQGAPKKQVICPFCGATTEINAAGCCEFCGGSLME